MTGRAAAMFKLEIYSSRSLNAIPPFSAPGVRAGGWNPALRLRGARAAPRSRSTFRTSAAQDAPEPRARTSDLSCAGLELFLPLARTLSFDPRLTS